jgi:hypothetical protein
LREAVIDTDVILSDFKCFADVGGGFAFPHHSGDL